MDKEPQFVDKDKFDLLNIDNLFQQEEINKLIYQVSDLKQSLQEAKDKYSELIMAVENTFEGETRHETALRYIKTIESSSKTTHQPKTNSPNETES